MNPLLPGICFSTSTSSHRNPIQSPRLATECHWWRVLPLPRVKAYPGGWDFLNKQNLLRGRFHGSMFFFYTFLLFLSAIGDVFKNTKDKIQHGTHWKMLCQKWRMCVLFLKIEGRFCLGDLESRCSRPKKRKADFKQESGAWTLIPLTQMERSSMLQSWKPFLRCVS